MKTQTGAWIQDRASIGTGLFVEPGLRVDWNFYDRRDGGAASLAVGEDGRPRLDLGRHRVAGADTRARNHAAGAPGTYDLTGPEQSALRNERSRQVVFGAEYPISRTMTVRVEAYRRMFDRLLQQRQENQSEYERRLARYEIPPDMPPDAALLEYRPTIHPDSTATGRGAGVELLLQRTHGRVFGWVSYVIEQVRTRAVRTHGPLRFRSPAWRRDSRERPGRVEGAGLRHVAVRVRFSDRATPTGSALCGVPESVVRAAQTIARWRWRSDRATLSRQPRAAGARQLVAPPRRMPAPTCASPWPSRNGSRRTAKS